MSPSSSLWTHARAALDPLARALGAYTAYRLHGGEHIGSTHDLTLPDARIYLRKNAYEPQYLSAAKRHPVTRDLHDLSYRRVPSRHPDAAMGTPLGERFSPGECQFHVHVFAWNTGRIDWYSHYETRPFKAPREHYWPTVGETYLRGVRDPVLELE